MENKKSFKKINSKASSFSSKDSRESVFSRDKFSGQSSGYSDRLNASRNSKKMVVSPNTGKAVKTKTASIDPLSPLRLNQFIAQSGVCSRREADELIEKGEITVNGAVVTQVGTKVLRSDTVEYQGKKLRGEKRVYIVMNKPKGYIASMEDPHNDKTVIDLLKNKVPQRVYPVGRLDKYTTGVLVLTNDGDLTKELTHPSYQRRKIYHVFLDKPITDVDIDKLTNGITLEDGEIHVDEISTVQGKRDEVGIEVHSGRNRIVRRMFEHLGYTVKSLDRVYFSGLTKLGLKRGFWRHLTEREVSVLRGKIKDK